MRLNRAAITSTLVKIRHSNAQMSLGRPNVVFKFSRGEVTLEVARRVNAREPMTSGQLQSIHLKKSTVVWIAGNIDLGNNSSSVPSTPPFLCFSVVSCE